MISYLFFRDAKNKYGRAPGQAGHEADSFLWNQGTFYTESDCGGPCGLHGLQKLEWNHTFSPNFFLNAKYAYFGWGYGFDPRGGLGLDSSINVITDEAYGSWVAQRFLKPWHNVLRRRQLLPRQARVQVRIRLSPLAEHLEHDLPGQRRRREALSRRGRRPGGAAERRQGDLQLHRLLRRRHLYPESPDPERGAALRPPDRLHGPERLGRQPDVPGSRSRPHLRRQRARHHLERRVPRG